MSYIAGKTDNRRKSALLGLDAEKEEEEEEPKSKKIFMYKEHARFRFEILNREINFITFSSLPQRILVLSNV